MSPTIIMFVWLVSRRALIWGSMLLGLSLFVKWVTATPRSKFPPGPKGLPLLGNVLQLGPLPWHNANFVEWKKLHGPMVYLNLAGQNMLILNDPKVAAELLDRRASIYSDRPRLIVASEIMTGDMALPFMRYGDLWRRMRRATHEAFSMKTGANYHPRQQLEAIILANDLIKNPGNLLEHLQRTAASAVTSSVYNMQPLKSTSDPAIVNVNVVVHRVAQVATPGAHLVEIFPILNYVPRSLAKWKRDAENFFLSYTKVFEDMYVEIQTRVLSGQEQRPSFCATLAETSSRHNMANKEAAWLAASMYLAGTDTPATALAWFMLAMTAFPEAQRMAQTELDEVVGRGRLPSFSDWDHLPYVRALVKEVIRWRPVAPLGIPHASIQDDWYEGYLIPKDTICVANIWAMNQDPDLFGPDATDFNPSRHLDDEGKLKPSQETKDEGHFSFGFGRRVCVGRFVANYVAFINIATILWAFKLEPPKDANGKFVQPDIDGCEINDGLLARPKSLRCVTAPRFPDVESLIHQAKEEALAKRDLPIDAD